MPLALAVSPHLDDAAFSCGATLAGLARHGWEVVVLTVFTASVADPGGFALACQLDKGLPAEADYMALRRAEDAAACAALGARPVWLPLAEAPHRGYGDAPALFGAVAADDPADAMAAAALAAPLTALGPALLLAPQAIGGHVDHVQVVRALHRLRPRPPILWWTDWPYAARPHSHLARPFEAAMAALPTLTRDGDRAAKAAACARYATQLGYQFGGPEGLALTLAAAGPEQFRRDGTLPAAWP